MTNVIRIALAIGALIDGGVAILCFFFQPLLGPLLDFPVKDPALTTVAGGEFLVVALVYVAILRDLDRARTLLEMLRGHVLISAKTVGPMPLNIALVIIFVLGATRKSSVRT